MQHNIIWAKPRGEGDNHRNHRGFIILCELPENQATPYVTWETNAVTDKGYRERGHYHFSYEEAKRDFLERK